jgi:hypothetical protein
MIVIQVDGKGLERKGEVKMMLGGAGRKEGIEKWRKIQMRLEGTSESSE